MTGFRNTLSCVLLLGVASWASWTQANNWPNWRGPHLNGVADPGVYPVEWAADKNVAWKVDLPGKAGSTPAVWNGKIAITCPIGEQNGIVCLDQSGKELWRAMLGTARPGKHKKGSGSNPSPVTDGERIFVYYKSGDFAALDWNGNVLWHENLQQKYGEDTLWWDLGTSPILTGDHVVVAVVQTGPSYLAAFDKKTGQTVWRVERNLDAPEEAAQTYSTPVATIFEGQKQIVVLGADHVTCHDATTGAELWRVGGLNPGHERYYRSISSPVIIDDIVIAPYARGNTLTAIKLGGLGDVTSSHVLWTKNFGADVPTPAASGGRVYVCNDKAVVTCLDARSGEEVWKTMLEKNRNAFSASPVLAADLLYLTREDGKTFVLDAATGETKSINSVGENEFVLSTPVLIDNEILLRTFDRLYCIRKGSAAVSAK
jgi:outer membrane protein assembly factor BamB